MVVEGVELERVVVVVLEHYYRVSWSVRSPDEGITPGSRISSDRSSGVPVVGGHVASSDVPAVLLPLLEVVGGDVVVVVLGGGDAVLWCPVLLRVSRAPTLPTTGGVGVPHGGRHLPALRLDQPRVGVNIGED